MRCEQTVCEVLNSDINHIEPMRRFGRMARPIMATEVYRRVVSTLMRNGIRVEKWILVNECDHTVTFATTYNGITGTHFDPEQNTHWLSWNTLRPKIEAYTYIPTDKCPIATPVSRPSALAANRHAN